MSPVPLPATQSRSRELLSQGVLRRLQLAILDGTLVAGERLHDDELIGWLGVSRTPIRTALERLTDLGLVEMQPNRFTRVALPTQSSLVHGLQVYAALIVSAVGGSITRLGTVDVVEFRERLAALEAVCAHGLVCADELIGAVGMGDRGDVWQREELEAGDRVLAFLARRSGNPLLVALLREVRMRLAFGFLSVGVPIDRGLVSDFCREIRSGVERRDEAAVARTLTEHLGPRLLGGGAATRFDGAGG